MYLGLRTAKRVKILGDLLHVSGYWGVNLLDSTHQASNIELFEQHAKCSFLVLKALAIPDYITLM